MRPVPLRATGLALALLVGCGDGSRVDDLLAAGRIHLERGDGSRALSAFEQAILEIQGDRPASDRTSWARGAAPIWAEAHLCAAEALIRLRDPEAALARFETIDAHFPAAAEEQRDRRRAIRKEAVTMLANRKGEERRRFLPDLPWDRPLR